jgi:hypothetical protein
MSTEAVVTQRDRAREAAHERRRRALAEQRLREAWEERRAEQRLAAQAQHLERLAEESAQAQGRHALILRRAEAGLVRLQEALAEAEALGAPVPAAEVRRVAMSWQDVEEIARLGQEFGYVPAGQASLPDGEEECAVDMLLVHGEYPPVGLVVEPEGLLVLSADPAVEAHFVDPIARTRAARLLVEYFGSRGARVEIRESPDGAVELVGCFQPSPEAGAVRVRLKDEGDAVILVEGMRGRGCQDLAREVAGAMRGSVVKSCPTPEYYLPATASGQERETHGI